MKILDLTFPDPASNLACDEALLDACVAGGGEVLRFWEARHPFVVVGYGERAGDEVDLEACARRGVPVMRRCSGGGTVLQGPGCLSYALVLRVSETGDGPLDSIPGANAFIMERHRAAFEAVLGAPVTLEGHTDLAVAGRKFSGNAQRRRRQALLFHGTILHGGDLTLMTECLRFPSRPPGYREGRGHGDFVRPLALGPVAIRETLVRAWGAQGIADAPDQVAVEALVRSKYSQAEWNLRR